jgi:peptide/nickel transport system substrate-binding protein
MDHPQEARARPDDVFITRREFLRGATAVGGAAVASAIIAACGATPTAAPANTAAPALANTAAAPANTPVPAVKAPKKGGLMTWGLEVAQGNLVPFGAISQGQVDSTEMLYDGLVEWDKDLLIKPAVAESWETPDDKTWIWHLRKGVKFHDGTEITADDVKYSIELQANPPPPGIKVGSYPKIASVDVVDKYTVKFNMTGPDPTTLGYLAWTRYSRIIPKDYYTKANPLITGIGTGPYKLTEYVDNDRVVNVRNADFWKPGLPYLDGLTLKVLTDETARVAALRAGQIDGCVISADTAKTLKNDPNIVTYRGPISAPKVLQFTLKGGKPWDKKEVRQAMSMAINRQDIIDKVFSGEALLTGPVPPGYGDWYIQPDELAKGVFKYDVAGAKAKLAAAGFPNGFDITLHAISAPAYYTQIGEIVKEQLKLIGINVSVVAEELALIAQRVGNGNFDFLATGRGMRGDVTGHLVDFGRTSAANGKVWFPAWKNEEMEKLYEQLAVNLDVPSRHTQARRIQDLVLDEVPHIYLVQDFQFQATRSYVKDHYVSFTTFNVALRTDWFDK